MSVPPFLSRYFIQWLASRTMERAQDVVTKEFQSRLESGDLGDYQGVLFPDVAKSSGAARRITARGVEFGVVASEKRELVGVLDALDGLKTSVGDGFKFYSGALKGCSVVGVETGKGLDRARRGAEALLQAFRPLRVVSVGFARSVGASLSSGALLAPNRLFESGSDVEFDLATLASPECEESSSAPPGTGALEFLSHISSGALMTLAECASVSEASERGAVAYDYSATAVARVCAAARAPCLVLRVIFDASSSARSAEAAKVMRSSGGGMARSLGALFGATLKNPSAALDVARVKAEEIESADKLARALKRIASLIERAPVASEASSSSSASE